MRLSLGSVTSGSSCCKAFLSGFVLLWPGSGRGIDACGRFSHDQLRLEPDLVRIRFIGELNALDEQLCCGPAHLVEWLAHCGEAGVEVLRHDDVVEPDDRDIVGAVEADIFDGANGADRGGVVEAEHGGEITGAGEQFAHGGVAELGRPKILFQIDAEFGLDDDAKLLRCGDDGLPTGFGVERVALTFHECDFAVPEVVEVAESFVGRKVVIEHHVGDAGCFAVGGDSYDRERDVE